jgi:hypothetical protein
MQPSEHKGPCSHRCLGDTYVMGGGGHRTACPDPANLVAATHAGAGGHLEAGIALRQQ